MKRYLITLLGGVGITLATLNPVAAADAAKVEALLKKHNCTQCHGIDKKILGPAYQDVAKKYKAQKDAAALLAKNVKAGSKGVWGQVPMPPNDKVSDAEIKEMVAYILSL